MADEWISAAEALKLVASVTDEYSAPELICSRAHSGLVKAKAARYIVGTMHNDDCIVPDKFWWSVGRAALSQNWATGDFETWEGQKHRLRAFGVTFNRQDIEAMIAPAKAAQSSQFNAHPKTGRPRAEFWDDLLIAVFKQIYLGKLTPTKQVHLEAAMKEWASVNGHEVSDSAIRQRAKRLWAAMQAEDNN
jgi:hypothetical protein